MSSTENCELAKKIMISTESKEWAKKIMSSIEKWELTINFFDGSNMKIDGVNMFWGIDDIKNNIMENKSDIVSARQLNLFVFGEEDKLTIYKKQKILFCLIKPNKQLKFDYDYYSMDDVDLQDDYDRVADYLREVVSNKYQDEDICVEGLLEYIREDLANNEFNTDDEDHEKIWDIGEDIIKAVGVEGILEKFHNIKDFIKETLEYDDNDIDMNNYKELYAYALAREWCDDVTIESKN